MFYKTPFDKQLRLGDVLKQQTTFSSKLNNKQAKGDDAAIFEVEIKKPTLAVVLTPCCSIDNNMIVITPLRPVNPNYFKNPYLKDDLTRLNRKMTGEQSMPPIAWQRLSESEKLTRSDKEYAFIENFVYEKSDYFPIYEMSVNKIIEMTNYYEIDFRNVSIINSENIMSENGNFIISKIAQLSIEARSDLREKISSYYGRIPIEDKVLDD